MFARLLAKKKEPGYVEDEGERRMKKIMDVVGKVDKQIDIFTKQAEAEQQKRTALMQQAANAKRAGKTVLLRRYLHAVKLSDQKYQRLSNMSIQLENQKNTCEAILQHSDFAKVCEDANMLVTEFGMDPDTAQNLIDKSQEWKDKLEELDEVMADGAEDEDIGDLEDELDMMLGEEDMAAMPDVPIAPVAAAPTAKAAPKPVQKAPVAEVAEEDLDSLLEGL